MRSYLFPCTCSPQLKRERPSSANAHSSVVWQVCPRSTWSRERDTTTATFHPCSSPAHYRIKLNHAERASILINYLKDKRPSSMCSIVLLRFVQGAKFSFLFCTRTMRTSPEVLGNTCFTVIRKCHDVHAHGGSSCNQITARRLFPWCMSLNALLMSPRPMLWVM